MLRKIISPVSVEEFFQRNWEKKPLVVNRRSPEYFLHLLTLDAIDQIITTSDIRFPDIRLISAERDIARDEYAVEGGRLKPDSVMKLFQEGATIILNHQHKWQPELATFCRAMEQYFSYPFQTNIYLTPPNAQGFDIHFDTHDVFVLQIVGQKDWRIFGRAIELPLQGQGFNPKEEDIGSVQMECSLKAGDLLYIPRGVLHKANSVDEVSLHATVGVLAKTWADLILEAVSQVIISDTTFRESLPVGFAKTDFDRHEAEEIFRKRVTDLVRKVDFDNVFEDFVKNFVDTRPPLLQGQLKQLSYLSKLAEHSVIRLREGVVYRLETQSDKINLSFYGKTIDLPIACEAALQKILSEREVLLKNLSVNKAADDALILVRRLIAEGFIEVVD